MAIVFLFDFLLLYLFINLHSDILCFNLYIKVVFLFFIKQRTITFKKVGLLFLALFFFSLKNPLGNNFISIKNYLLILLALIISSKVQAQVVDTSYLSTTYSTSLKQIKNISKIAPDSLSKKFLNDSLYLEMAKNQLNEADSALRSAVKSLTSPKFKKEGSAYIEAFATNAQNPLQLNEKQYLRADVNATVTLMGLPFNTGFYYTTEDQSLYNTNRAYFSFDAGLYKQRLTDSYQAQQEALLRKHKLRGYNISQLSAQEDKLKNELDKLKGELPDSTAVNREINRQKLKAESKAREEAENRKQHYLEKGDSLRASKENQLKDSFESRKNNYSDSLESRQSDLYDKHQDTQLLNRYNRLQKKLEHLQKQKSRLEALQQNDTLNKAMNFATNPKDAKAELLDKAQGNMKLFMATDRFDIGAINPVYSEFTTMGTLLRGGEWQLSNEKYFGAISLGRTTVNMPSLFTRSKPEFGRNFGFVQAGMGSKEKSFIALNLMGAKDGKQDSLDLSNPPIQNTVVSIEGKYTLKDHWITEGELAQSSYKFNNSADAPIVTLNDVPVENQLQRPNLAYRIKSTYKGKKNTEASASLRQVNPAFKTVGNIFLRNNMMEYEFQLKQSFYKKRIQLTTFYKQNKDNVFEVLETTNRMKGYGGTLNISIPKWPILTVGYMPYEQGNNHPDSILQTNNHFSMLFANLSYVKRIKVWSLMSTASFSQSEMQIRNSDIFTTSNMYQATLMAQYKNKLQSAISYAHQSTNPGIDTLNSQSASLNIMYNISRKFRIGAQGNGLLFKSGGYKYEGGLSLDWKVSKSSSLHIEGNIGRLRNIWGLDNEAMRNGLVSWMVSF